MINQTFVQVSEYLKEHGVKNHNFMLRQIHDGVDDIDIFNPNITDEEKKMVRCEIQENVWYFLRTVVRIPHHGNLSKFIANIQNVSMIYCSEKGSNVYVQTPRGTFSSGSISTYMMWLILTGRTNVWQVDENRDSPYTRAVRIISGLPEWISDEFLCVTVNRQVSSQCDYNEVKSPFLLKNKKPPYEDLLIVDDFEYTKHCFDLIVKDKHSPFLVSSTVGPDTEESLRIRDYRNKINLFTLDMFDLDKLPSLVRIKFKYQEIAECGQLMDIEELRSVISDPIVAMREIDVMDV